VAAAAVAAVEAAAVSAEPRQADRLADDLNKLQKIY
jgi:hypothetical protein